MNALEKQIAGTHYKSLPIQPVEYCQKNQLGFCEASVVKYVTRHKDKAGREDILKAIHFLELLLEIEYPLPQPQPAPTNPLPVESDSPF
jgi:hypothetical protein